MSLKESADVSNNACGGCFRLRLTGGSLFFVCGVEGGVLCGEDVAGALRPPLLLVDGVGDGERPRLRERVLAVLDRGSGELLDVRGRRDGGSRTRLGDDKRSIDSRCRSLDSLELRDRVEREEALESREPADEYPPAELSEE